MTRKLYTEVVENVGENVWELHFYKPCSGINIGHRVWTTDSFKYKRHAVIGSLVYNSFYNSGQVRGSLEEERINVWESMMKIMRERGIE